MHLFVHCLGRLVLREGGRGLEALGQPVQAQRKAVLHVASVPLLLASPLAKPSKNGARRDIPPEAVRCGPGRE